MRAAQGGRASKATRERPQMEELARESAETSALAPAPASLEPPPRAAARAETARTTGVRKGRDPDLSSPNLRIDLDVEEFRRRLMLWYAANARTLPWRGMQDPYKIWVSEVMLQQTRVVAVIDHYRRFLSQFPTLLSLALASEPEVLAAWSGLGYYRRARMMHKAAQFITEELAGIMPRTAIALKTLPGVGEYTCAAIASIAFGESIPVLDGNVERVLLRVLGLGQTSTVKGRNVLQRTAQALVPPAHGRGNAPGDHNQAMMELGATLCLPRAPLCLNCPVLSLCKTRGEHVTRARESQKSRPIAYLLNVRNGKTEAEVLLQKRPAEATLMPGMYELPALPEDAVQDHAPIFVTRHAITNTYYHVRVFSDSEDLSREILSVSGDVSGGKSLIEDVAAQHTSLRWVATSGLRLLPLTGLARKVLRRLTIMPADPLPETPHSSWQT